MIRIAVLEDEAPVREELAGYLRRYTRQHGAEFEVSLFADEDEILENYRPNWDIILLDVEMPRLDGMTTAERIRKLDSEVILIFITNMVQYARCNSGYLVNLAQVRGMQDGMVLVGPHSLQISRPRRKAFVEALTDYVGGVAK